MPFVHFVNGLVGLWKTRLSAVDEKHIAMLSVTRLKLQALSVAINMVALENPSCGHIFTSYTINTSKTCRLS